MNIAGTKLTLFSILCFSLFTIGALAQPKQWVDGQAATTVLGQIAFDLNERAVGNNRFDNPCGVAIDAATGKVFVSDFDSGRVLRFTSAQAMTNGGIAEAVLGQPDFTSISAAVTQNKMYGPEGIFVDAAGRLWVADTFNHRVLRFDNAATLANGAPADAVLGQPDFTTNTQAVTQNKFTFPRQVFLDSAGRLWVADGNANRVLRFDNAATKANGANADGVLGQPDFTSSAAASTQSGMSYASGLTVDAAGRLWVAELNNNRVTRFDNAAVKANGAPADAVLGQTNFTNFFLGIAQNRMQGPSGVTTDSFGRLYVSDRTNNRVLIFNNASTLPNGANASNVIGQSVFNYIAEGRSATRFAQPDFLFYDEATQYLFVPENGNNRVTRFTPAGLVSINGRVVTVNAVGIYGARVELTDEGGNTRTAITNQSGYFNLLNIGAGVSYTAKVLSKRYTFTPQTISVTGNISGLILTAQPK